MAAKTKRTVLRSSAEKRLYAVRDKGGNFKDIQSYARAQRTDLAASTKTETSKKSRLSTAMNTAVATKKNVKQKPAIKAKRSKK